MQPPCSFSFFTKQRWTQTASKAAKWRTGSLAYSFFFPTWGRGTSPCSRRCSILRQAEAIEISPPHASRYLPALPSAKGSCWRSVMLLSWGLLSSSWTFNYSDEILKTTASFQRVGNEGMEKQLAQGQPRSCASLGFTPHLIVLSTRSSIFPACLFQAVSFYVAFLLSA